MVDKDATEETRALFLHLRDEMDGTTLFGQIDANVMGIDETGKGWFLEDGRCDTHTVTGRYPAVYGFDIRLLNQGWTRWNGHIVAKAREAYSRGGVVTVEWRSGNAVTGDGLYPGSAVPHLLPGAPGNRQLVELLDHIADHLGNLRDEKGRSIPVILRPWHAPNCGRHWWSTSRCTPAEYIRLYRFTVSHLRDVRRVHNFIYAFSVSLEGGTFTDALECYPGDDWVDVMGLDSFGDAEAAYVQKWLEHVRQLVTAAERKRKVPSLTSIGFKKSDRECGLGYCETPHWLTNHVVGPLKSDPVARRIGYMVFWRNDASNARNYHLPHPGSVGKDDLIAAASDPYLVMGDRLEGLYTVATDPVGAATLN